MVESEIASVEPVAKQGRRTSRKLIVVGLLLVVAIGYLFAVSIPKFMSYYMTLDELKAKGNAAYNEKLRVGARVTIGSIEKDVKAGTLRFIISQGEDSLPVVYTGRMGQVPDIFGDDIEVVVEGKYLPSGIFEAYKIEAKCPSKMTAKLETAEGGGQGGK
ncbi:MAG: cytochrome c maturation protein CcmE [Chloroflexi bacterium]|nr:cytochrome c maturation protein CcmE [Chloroflexota bacterium]